MSFSAAFDKWIPVVSDGKSHKVSLESALDEGHQIDGLDLNNPLSALTIMRLLVATQQRIAPVTTPAELRRAWEAKRMDSATVHTFFEENADHFELFHEERPFMQVANLEPSSGDPKSPLILDLAAATGNNVPLFSSKLETNHPELPPDDALLGLLTLQGWDTAAIKPGAKGDPQVKAGKTTGNRTGLLGYLGAVVPIGQNLHETILLNTPLVPIPPDDVAAWERCIGPQWEERQPRGPLELLTWQSRRMRLVPNEQGLVTGVVMSAGDRLDFIPPEWEPHTRWQQTKKGDAVPVRPLRWQPGRQAWRGLDSLLERDDAASQHTSLLLKQIQNLAIPDEYPLNILCVGVTYGNQSAVIEDVFVDRIPLPVMALNDETGAIQAALTDVVLKAGAVRDALNHLDSNLRRACGAEPIDWKQGVHPGDDAMPLLDLPTHTLLQQLQDDPETWEVAISNWQSTAREIALTRGDDLLDKAPLMAFKRRKVEVHNRERIYSIIDAAAIFKAELSKAFGNTHTTERNL